LKTIARTGDSAQLELSTRELTILNNALNEVCNGLRELDDENEFHARLGIERAEARKLLAGLDSLLDTTR